MYYNLLIHLPTEVHLGCFKVLGLMNKAAINRLYSFCAWMCFQCMTFLFSCLELKTCWSCGLSFLVSPGKFSLVISFKYCLSPYFFFAFFVYIPEKNVLYIFILSTAFPNLVLIFPSLCLSLQHFGYFFLFVPLVH